jgi:hypothetical protein
VRGVDLDKKKGTGLLIKAKCNVTAQSQKTAPVDSATPTWPEELTFV